MQETRPPRYFWARAVALQLLVLGLWWGVFYRPSQMLLRIAAEVPLALFTARQQQTPLEIDAAGEWKFSIPVYAVVREPAKGAGPLTVDAIEFAAPPENVAPFTTGWFVYLGLALNVVQNRQNGRRILIGLGIQTAVSALALFAYAELNALGVLANMHRVPDPVTVWLIKLAYHIVYLVVPYAGPYLILLATMPQWWDFLSTGEFQKDPVKRLKS